jgi:hypothetical protein
MVLFRGAYILILILLAALVAGCILPYGPVNGASIDTVPTKIIPGITTNESFTTELTLLTICPVRENTKPWITVNPVGDHYLGDVIEINGTTNIESGEVQIFIKDTVYHSCVTIGPVDAPCPCCGGITITAPIIRGICGNNTWSSEINTSQHQFYPAQFGLWVINRDVSSIDQPFEFLIITDTLPRIPSIG